MFYRSLKSGISIQLWSGCDVWSYEAALVEIKYTCVMIAQDCNLNYNATQASFVCKWSQKMELKSKIHPGNDCGILILLCTDCSLDKGCASLLESKVLLIPSLVHLNISLSGAWTLHATVPTKCFALLLPCFNHTHPFLYLLAFSLSLPSPGLPHTHSSSKTNLVPEALVCFWVQVWNNSSAMACDVADNARRM